MPPPARTTRAGPGSRSARPSRRRPATPGWRGTSRAHHLDDESLVALPVELGIKDALPRAEVETPRGHRNDDLVMHEHRLEMRVAVVLTGAVVPVVFARRRQLLQPLPDVGMQAALVIVDEHARRDVH